MHLDFQVKPENDRKDTFGTSPFPLICCNSFSILLNIPVSLYTNPTKQNKEPFPNLLSSKIIIFLEFIFISSPITTPVACEPNNWLYRSGLDPLSATNLCYVIILLTVLYYLQQNQFLLLSLFL